MNDDYDRAQRMRGASPFLTTKQAAHYLNLSPVTLKKMRASGRGPAARLHTKAWFYHIDDLQAWSNARKEEQENAQNKAREEAQRRARKKAEAKAETKGGGHGK